MFIAPGSRVGSYEILAPLGAGGMGEVYRAADTRLGREVAIQVLPDAFARDPERLARFEREARVLAQLNHPGIAAIYGFEKVDGVSFLVLEFVPGETLRGPLPPDEVLAIARQLGEALEAAHDKGIIHRDLKPANIKITPEGKIKVLDFGLAKAFTDEAAEGDPTHSPTLSIAATRGGVLLGTAAYMSPEQARGRPLDRRTDIWAFGCVRYELLTGRQLFGGETISDTLAAVLRAEPDFSALPPNTPPHLRRLLQLCLERDPARRLRDIGDAWLGTWGGPRLVFYSVRQGGYQLYQKTSSGAAAEELLLKSGPVTLPTDWSPDGRFLLYTLLRPQDRFRPLGAAARRGP
jgi:serine/threonine protein kinase